MECFCKGQDRQAGGNGRSGGVAMEGLEAMEQWMRELGLAMNITDCGAKPEQIEGMADACPICQGGYYILNRDEVVQVLKDSL